MSYLKRVSKQLSVKSLYYLALKKNVRCPDERRLTLSDLYLSNSTMLMHLSVVTCKVRPERSTHRHDLQGETFKQMEGAR
ncbi:hypothetical protein [uncultured Methylophaga sp.]|uniref:hypothetical protein n=1 Tax=uncultured Methylophaga sp. TaxID=285271 RepID=UPI0026322F01|nr:hypothetical protein [uncultured Methylophaga sp.]